MDQIAIHYRVIFVDNTETVIAATAYTTDEKGHIFTLEDGGEQRIPKDKVKRVISAGVAPTGF